MPPDCCCLTLLPLGAVGRDADQRANGSPTDGRKGCERRRSLEGNRRADDVEKRVSSLRRQASRTPAANCQVDRPPHPLLATIPSGPEM